MKSKTYISISALVLLFFSCASFASGYEPNMNDKLDSYPLLSGGQQVGKITVQATVGEEPMFAPVEITFKLQCLKGFSSKNFKKVVTWQTYDYGNPSRGNQLSSFDPQKQDVIVYYRTAKVDASQTVVVDKSKTNVFHVKNACVRD